MKDFIKELYEYTDNEVTKRNFYRPDGQRERFEYYSADDSFAINYEYDNNNRIVAEIYNTGATFYFSEFTLENGNVLRSMEDNGTLITDFVYDSNRLLFVVDYLNNVKLFYDEDGRIVERDEYYDADFKQVKNIQVFKFFEHEALENWFIEQKFDEAGNKEEESTEFFMFPAKKECEEDYYDGEDNLLGYSAIFDTDETGAYYFRTYTPDKEVADNTYVRVMYDDYGNLKSKEWFQKDSDGESHFLHSISFTYEKMN